MTDNVLHFPGRSTDAGPADGMLPEPTGTDHFGLGKLYDVTTHALKELRTTEDLTRRAQDAMQDGDLERMVEVRDLLSARIALRHRRLSLRRAAASAAGAPR